MCPARHGMLAHDAVIGGEGNGGVIDPGLVLCRDSHISMALILELLAREGRPLSAIVDELPRYAIHKEKVALDRARVAELVPELRGAAWATGAEVDERDGIKFSWADRWVHLRASGTEPVSRIISEAPTAKEARALAATVRTTAAARVITGH